MKTIYDATGILKRHPSNPIIDPKDFPGIAAIFNPSPAMYNGKTMLLLSVMPYKMTRDGETWLAESEDGVSFTVKKSPFIVVHEDKYPYNIICKHIIDNRITKIDDTYYIITPVIADEFGGPAAVLGKTMDFETYEKIEVISQPPNRGASLFPEKIDGKYYKLDRASGGAANGCIWLSSSPDLIHWGCCRPVIYSFNYWNRKKIGATPPIKTSHGWLEIIHGVWDNCGGGSYYIGAILLDLHEPWKVIGKAMSWLLGPEEPYETKGLVDNVVFPCGAIADEQKDELRLYYGAADTCVGLATGRLSDVIYCCKNEI